MIKTMLGLALVCVLAAACKTTPKEDNAGTTENISTMNISQDKALAIAEADAKVAYRDLSIYKVACKLEDDKWKVEYLLKDENSLGGGPHYVIDAKTGAILEKRYYQ